MEKNKCQYCGNDTDNSRMYLAMTIPIEEYEKKIDKLGRKNWWEKLNFDTPSQEVESLMFYDQLLNTIGKGYACNKCLEKEDELLNKYYRDDEQP